MCFVSFLCSSSSCPSSASCCSSFLILIRHTRRNSSHCALLHIRRYFFLLLFVLYLTVSTITIIIMVVWISVDRIDFLHLKSNNAGGSCVHKCVLTVCHICVVAFIFFFSLLRWCCCLRSVPFHFVPFLRSFNSSHLIGWNVILQWIFLVQLS